jgi:hypothetical protein
MRAPFGISVAKPPWSSGSMAKNALARHPLVYLLTAPVVGAASDKPRRK